MPHAPRTFCPTSEPGLCCPPPCPLVETPPLTVPATPLPRRPRVLVVRLAAWRELPQRVLSSFDRNTPPAHMPFACSATPAAASPKHSARPVSSASWSRPIVPSESSTAPGERRTSPPTFSRFLRICRRDSRITSTRHFWATWSSRWTPRVGRRTRAGVRCRRNSRVSSHTACCISWDTTTNGQPRRAAWPTPKSSCWVPWASSPNRLQQARPNSK